MKLADYVQFARRIMREVRNGCTRAIHYLRSLRFSDEFIRWALLGR
jgi:hypothetical protein